MRNQRGDAFITVITLVFLGILVALLSLRFEASEQVVSGVVYNNTNNAFLSGNTSFSVRAAENTFVTEENQSSYCLPPNSKYIVLVNKAAADKDVKVVVTTNKFLALVFPPWACVENVKVELKN